MDLEVVKGGKKMVQKIKCNKCGKEKQAGEPRFSNLVKKFGGESQLRAQYNCRDCRPKDDKPKKVSSAESVEDKVRRIKKENPELSYTEIGKKANVDRRKVSKILNS